MNVKKILLVGLQIIFILSCNAQSYYINDVLSRPLKTVALNAKDSNINNYQQERELVDEYLKQINSNFSTGTLRVLSTPFNDKKHIRFDVLYKGFILEDYKLTLHPLSDTTFLITGMNLFNENIMTIPLLSEEQIIEKLKSENDILTNASISSVGLVVYKALKGEPHFCYKLKVYISLLESYHYYVSAITGDIIETDNLVCKLTSAIGLAELDDWGIKSIYTSQYLLGNAYFLYDQEANIQTYNLDGEYLLSEAMDFSDEDNFWTFTEFPETPTYSLNAGLVCHWGARQTYDFFYDVFNHQGYDGNNSKLEIYVNRGGETFSGDVIAWSPDNNAILVGSGNSRVHHHLGSVDFIAHEYGHAVANSFINLRDTRECGAIKEGLSDIWAACVENYIGGQTDYEIWNIGDHLDSTTRDMSNPKRLGDPSTYLGENWHTSYTDSYGIHTNCNVLNYWFYLLTMGGEGINDNQERYEVEGVGFSISQEIVFLTLFSYLDADTDFPRMRDFTLQATADLYGDTSNVYKQVTNAWHAVGVGAPYMNANIVGDFSVCDGGVYSIYVHPEVSINWSVDKFEDVLSLRDKLIFVSGQGTETLVVNRGTSLFANTDGSIVKYKGNVRLTATLTYRDSVVTKIKSLYSNNPLPEIQYTVSQSSGITLNSTYKFYVTNVSPLYLSWRVEAGDNIYTARMKDSIVVNLPKYRTYDVIVSLSDIGGCSTSNYQTLVLDGIQIVLPTLSYENPVSTNSSFYLMKENEESNDDTIYDIEIWSESRLIRSLKFNSNEEFMVSTVGITPGIYFMRIYKNGEFLEIQKLIVK